MSLKSSSTRMMINITDTILYEYKMIMKNMMESRLTAMILEFIKELLELKHAYHHCDLVVHDIQS